MIHVNPSIPGITLNVNGLNMTIKNPRFLDQKRKPKSNYICLQKNHCDRSIQKFESPRMEKV